jgi:hypothetical protein
MGETNIEGGELMIADELRELFNEIKSELVLLRADVMLINHDMLQVREQLDRIENGLYAQTQEPIGIAPGTPPATFIPPGSMDGF